MKLQPFHNMIRNLFRFSFFVSIITIYYLALSNQTSQIDIVHFDKLKHALAFLWLTALYAVAWPHTWWIRFIIMFLLGFTIEAVQYFLPYRAASGLDLLADTAGICLFELLRLSFRNKFNYR